jgi:hypothetical protein
METFPVGGSSVAFPVNLQSTAGCTYTGSLSLKFTIEDLWALLAGYIPTWNFLDTGPHTLTLAGGGTLTFNDTGENPQLASCTTPVARVVRFDTSGTTQAVLNFLNGAINTNQNQTTQQNCSATGQRADKAAGTTLPTTTWSVMDTNIAGSKNANEAWPGETSTDGSAPVAPCVSPVWYATANGG